MRRERRDDVRHLFLRPRRTPRQTSPTTFHSPRNPVRSLPARSPVAPGRARSPCFDKSSSPHPPIAAVVRTASSPCTPATPGLPR
ncbi:hypothetical protein BE221DRAFT_76050 [Ostreococcus tauri]|uniref:Uncharacterized protein n=1 Tax=Ostreococcus tauri TaxID=70448 RepID=A0A1Y5IB21_OSTTA|nr:hypothetical protein BE221DRAFT_76050 [Ostreococcus tauri]